MYFGCASVLQSIVTSVPDGAPTSWFGTNIIGETVHSSSVWFHSVCFMCVCVCRRCRWSERVGACFVCCVVWIGLPYRMCVYMRVIAFWAIGCNAENTWEPKRRYYNFCLNLFVCVCVSFHSFVVWFFFVVGIQQRNDDKDIKSIHCWALQRDENNGASAKKYEQDEKKREKEKKMTLVKWRWTKI